MDLTYKQRLFVEAYLGKANGNAVEAARIAGYRTPHPEGVRLLRNATIKAAVEARLDQAAMPANEVLARLSEIASGSLEHFFDVTVLGSWEINLTKAKKRDKLRLLKKMKTTKEGPEIEIHDPVGALDKLAKFHGLYKLPLSADSLDPSIPTDEHGNPVEP